MSKNKKDETALELDDILSEPITNSQKLAAFLQRKAADAQKPKNSSGLVFGNFSFDLDFDVRLIKKPQKDTQENKLKPLQELDNANANIPAAAEPPDSDGPQSPSNLAPHENLPPRSVRHSPSPTQRRPPRRSGTGGHVPGSDKLRRHAIHRRSQSCGRRQLLQDFDDAANLSRSSSSPFPFVPEISSTPNCSEKAVENQPASQQQPQPKPASEPQQMNRPAVGSDFAAEITEICEKRLALFQNSMMQMSQKGEVPSSRPGSSPLTPSDRHRTYTIEKRPISEQLQQLRSSPNISHSKMPMVRVRRFETTLAPDIPNSLDRSERESAPVEDYFVPETQPQQSQQLVEIVHNLSRNGSVVVIPMGGAFSPKPDAAGPLPQPHLPAASDTGVARVSSSTASVGIPKSSDPTVSANNPKSSAPAVSAGTPKSSAPTFSAGTPKSSAPAVSDSNPESSTSKRVSHNKTPQIVEDLDAIMTDDESDEQPSACALNLVPAGGNTTRQSRMRKRNNRKPSDDQESSIKLLNLHRSNASSKSKRKGATALTLNKAPSAPINGEQFARELERMSNYEILDLRKRNSLGRVYPLNGNRKQNSAEHQEVLEQNIQREIMRRNLGNETETESLSSTVSAEREELAYSEEALAMPPPAPVGFKDNSQGESRRQSKERQKRPSRSRRREVPMTAELVNYIALSKTMELRRKSSRNSSKRSLYTKGDSEGEDVGSVSPVKQPRLSPTRQEPTPGGSRIMQSQDIVEEVIAIVPPPPRSLRYSQCLRDMRRSSKSDFDGVMATPLELDDEETPLLAPPPPEYNDNTDVDGADVQGKSSFSVSADAQRRLSKSRVRYDRTEQISPLPPEERSKFDDQSDRTPNRNIRKSKRHEPNPPSPETNEATEMHETVLPRMSKNNSRRLSRVATQEDDIVEPPCSTMADDDRTTDQRSEQREVLPIITSSLPDTTSVTDEQPSTSRAALEALARGTNDPEHDPDPEAVARAVVEEEAVLFKKPKARAPRAKSKVERELNNLKVSYIHNEVEVDGSESAIRRSRRGQVPLKNTWCHTVSDPRQFDFFCKSAEIYEAKKAKPSKQSSMSRRTKISLMNRPPLCSSTPRLSGEPLHAPPSSITENFEPPKPSECSSLGVAPLRWDDNELIEQVEDIDAVKPTKKRGRPKKTSQAVVMETDSDSAAAALMPPPPVPKIKERRKKKQAKQKTVTETETELESDPDPITPMSTDSGAPNPPTPTSTPSPSMSDDHQAASMHLMNWLRGYNSNQPIVSLEDCSGSRIGKSVSVAGELVFTKLDDIEYAFYDTKDKATVGYMRFQPLQSRQTKRAKGFSLKFVVLFGQFGMDCSVPGMEEDDRCTLNIGDMVEIEKGTRYSIQNLLDEVSVLMVIRN
ncbi:uncharacterized protein LOC111065565 [Drosophila obscura]|uniref:uncharacterized protein LOC111065565 n=1 Tax=Drosophila obscura TaxID=7282 RepID=UPI001BB11E64|nr:uncharacterized protein LOC111065565 [Drosophila obscura]